MPRLKWTGRGVFRDGQTGVVAGPGPGRPLVHEVSEETARRFLDHSGWVQLDDTEETEETDAAVEDEAFDLEAWLDHDYEDRVERVRNGEVDEHLDQIEAEDTSKNVVEAAEERLDSIR